MTIRIFATAIACWLFYGAVPGGKGQQPIIAVFATVDADKGDLVRGLAPNDFKVLVDDGPQPVQDPSAGELPLSLIVLVDVSGSMLPLPARRSLNGERSGIDPRDIRRAIERLIALRRAEDRFRVGTFGARIEIGPLLSNDSRQQSTILDSVSEVPEANRHGPSPMWDALVTAVDTLATEPGHRSVLLISDGRATGNRIGHREAIQRASLARVTVSVIAPSAVREIRLGPNTVLSVDPGVFLRSLTDGSGGLLVSFGSGDRSVVPFIDKIIGDLRRRHKIDE